MAKAVRDDPVVKGMPPAIGTFLRDGVMTAGQCNKDHLKSVKDTFPTLGQGELESISIVAGCKDPRFRGYLILTDDVSAQGKAGRLGMSSLDSPQFVLLPNEKQILSKQAAEDTLARLDCSVYGIGREAMGDCLRRLR